MGLHAYRISRDDPEELTPLTDREGWHQVNISPDLMWLVDQYSTPTQPPMLIARSVDGRRQHVIAESTLKLQDSMIVPQLMLIPSPDGAMLPALIVRPESAGHQRTCPVVIEVYGGPQAPSVSQRWQGKRSLYRELLARRGIATLVIDNRSSAGRGSIDSWPIHRRVGEIEFQDYWSASIGFGINLGSIRTDWRFGVGVSVDS